MNIRKITSMTMLTSVLLLLVNSVVLYLVPEGRVAYWADWHMIGLTKSDWGNQHITVGVLFLLASILHIYFNWSVITAYMKNKAREIKVFTGSFNVAMLITVLVAVGTYYHVPPMSSVLQFGEYLKMNGEKKYGSPPYGHAELSSIKMFAKKEGLDAEKAVELLKAAGLAVTDVSETLKVVAQNNKLTPQQVYEIIRPAKREVPVSSVGGSDTAGDSGTSFPDHPRSGFGKRSLEDLCAELGLELEMVVNGLNAMGIKCSGSESMKAIGAANDKEPMEIFEAIHSLVVKD